MKKTVLAFLTSSLKSAIIASITLASLLLAGDALGAQRELSKTAVKQEKKIEKKIEKKAEAKAGGKAGGKVTLFLAASLQPALQRLLDANPQLQASLVPASSGLLARQIYFGAPSDIYITAHPKWSAWLKEKRVKIIAQRPLLSNRLALISSRDAQKRKSQKRKNLASKDSTKRDLTIANLRQLLRGADKIADKIAIGDPAHVPVGGYAQQAFVALGLNTTEFTSRLVPLINTRATVLHVERGEAELGIVYLSDALQTKRANLEGLLPANLHETIRYDMLLLDERARELYDFLASPVASELFAKLGFIPLGFIPLGFIPLGFIPLGFTPLGFTLRASSPRASSPRASTPSAL